MATLVEAAAALSIGEGSEGMSAAVPMADADGDDSDSSLEYWETRNESGIEATIGPVPLDVVAKHQMLNEVRMRYFVHVKPPFLHIEVPACSPAPALPP